MLPNFKALILNIFQSFLQESLSFYDYKIMIGKFHVDIL